MFQGSCAQQQTAILKIALHEENKSGVDLLKKFNASVG
jgi:hypothetical protein